MICRKYWALRLLALGWPGAGLPGWRVSSDCRDKVGWAGASAAATMNESMMTATVTIAKGTKTRLCTLQDVKIRKMIVCG